MPVSWAGTTRPTKRPMKMGKALLLIRRDPDEYGVAKLFTINSLGDTTYEGTALAKGPCWIGRTFKICAPADER
jgi:hypothetical protein